jgi:major membrane immunogen (membrane-anchored lipoprotein)
MKLLVSLVTASLLLTGCSKSLSLDDQTKLLEYEKCLDAELAFARMAFDNAADYKRSEFIRDQRNEAFLIAIKKMCQGFKP